MLTFTVYGVAQPQGSARAFYVPKLGRSVITSDNPKMKPWRQEVAGTALAAMAEARVLRASKHVPIVVVAQFYFPKPKSARKRDVYKVTRPDADKLARSLLDSLTGIAYEDDAQVVSCAVSKHFGEPARAEVSVSSAEVA